MLQYQAQALLPPPL